MQLAHSYYSLTSKLYLTIKLNEIILVKNFWSNFGLSGFELPTANLSESSEKELLISCEFFFSSDFKQPNHLKRTHLKVFNYH